MDALKAIEFRTSYRGRYKPEAVPRDDLLAILRAGLAAPSGCNKQTASLIAVDDPDTLKQLRAVIQPPIGETAPAMICVLTQRIPAYRGRCFAVQDYAAAIENMLLAIVALGYQSCWVEGHITDEDAIGRKWPVSWACRTIMSWSASCRWGRLRSPCGGRRSAQTGSGHG